MMNKYNELKQYHLNTEEIETKLQTKYGDDIKPVDQQKLQKQRINQQRKAANIVFKSNAKLAERQKSSN
jgi:hypothetical protein